MKYTTSLFIAAHLLYGCGLISKNNSSPSTKEEWNDENAPAQLKSRYEVELAKLPLSAELTRKPWTDSYWPTYLGGIAHRWNDPDTADSFSYPLESKRENVVQLSKAALKAMSPAEKYDLLMGRLDYPLVNEERSRTNADAPKWEGLCHGWAPASLAFDEPHPVNARSKLGIDIPFGSSDIKALLTFAQQMSHQARTLGERCNFDLSTDPAHKDDPACRDTNAGSFHIVIANQIGLLQEGFVADVTRDLQVWNQPIYGFKSRLMSESDQVYAHAAPGTVKIATIQTEMLYLAELGAAWDPKPFDAFPSQGRTLEFQYNLELNDRGEIIGGEWLTKERPDFLWIQPRAEFSGYFKPLTELYKRSTR